MHVCWIHRHPTAIPAKRFVRRTAGGVINITTKGGSQEFHGGAWEYLRNSALDANSFFNNRNGVKKFPFRRNTYGGNFGGPIWKAKKIYGFFNADYLREASPATRVTTLPTVAERQGNFNQTLNADGSKVNIYDPLTTIADPNNPGKFIRSPFAGNVIPTSGLDPVALAVLKLLSSTVTVTMDASIGSVPKSTASSDASPSPAVEHSGTRVPRRSRKQPHRIHAPLDHLARQHLHPQSDHRRERDRRRGQVHRVRLSARLSDRHHDARLPCVVRFADRRAANAGLRTFRILRARQRELLARDARLPQLGRPCVKAVQQPLAEVRHL
jgi:hypothetical protein